MSDMPRPESGHMAHKRIPFGRDKGEVIARAVDGINAGALGPNVTAWSGKAEPK